MLLLREIDKQHGITRQFADAFPDSRMPSKVRHSVASMLAQRIYALADGYEDFNDHEHLRFDHALQSAHNTDTTLAGKSTLSRLEQRADRQSIIQAHRLLWGHFIQRHSQPPQALVLDWTLMVPLLSRTTSNPASTFTTTMAITVTCHCMLFGHELLVSYLRSSDRSDAHHSLAVLSLFVRFLRAHWPDTRIGFRGDAGFYRLRLLAWCDRYGIGYLVGFTKSSALVERQMAQAKTQYEHTGKKAVRTCVVPYQART